MGYKIQPVHSLSGAKGGNIAPPSQADEGKTLVAKNGEWSPASVDDLGLAAVAKSGEYSDLNNVPDLSAYADKAETEQAIQNVFDAIGDIAQFKTAVVDELPAEGEASTIYFLRNGEEEGNACKEYIFIDGSWELIGDTSIDLSPYVTWNSIGAAAQSNDYEDLDNLPVIPSVPIALSEFANDVGFITADDIPKNLSELNNDEGFITANDIPEIPQVPEVVSAFENDARYITIDEVDAYIKSRCKTDEAAAGMGYMAKVGDELYDSVVEVVNASVNDEPVEIKMTGDVADGSALLLMNAEGDTSKDITLDFNGHEYTAVTAGGSAGTQTQALHLEKGNKVTIKGGSLSALVENPNIKMLIQNYSELVLENMELDCSDNANISYVVSNNFGSCTIKNCHIIPAENKVAVDCWFGLSQAYDEGVHVVIEDSIIDGTIEYGAQRQALSRSGNEEWWKKAVLEISNSRIHKIVNSGADSDPSHCTIILDGEAVGFGDYSVQTADKPEHNPLM